MSPGISDEKVQEYLELIEFTERHPCLSKLTLSLISSIPVLRNALPVSTRIYMGGRILESYRVDKEKGEISFAGVDRQIVGSEFLEIVHRNFKEAMGEEEAQKAMYDMHYRAMEEQLAKLDFQSVLPAFCVPLFEAPVDISLLDSRPALARLYGKMESMLLRLLFNESGWGSPAFDSVPVPGRVTVRNSVESEWMPPSEEPVCYAMAGLLAAFVSHIAGERYLARETQCAAAGAPECVFTIEKEEAGKA
jgi:predicted hydrocarbon binding protein